MSGQEKNLRHERRVSFLSLLSGSVSLGWGFDRDFWRGYHGCMKKKQQKITTIEDLATLMQGEFLVIRERFDGVDQRFDGIDQRFDEVDRRFDELEKELKEEINEVRMIVNRIDTRTQNQVDAMYEDTTVLKKDVKEAKADIISIKTHVGLAA